MSKQTSLIQRLICAIAILVLLNGCSTILVVTALALGARPGGGGGGGPMCVKGDYSRDEDELDESPVYRAIKDKQLSKVKKYLDTPQKINTTQFKCNKYPHTYLHYAIYVHSYEVALFLIENGANVKDIPKDSYPLLYAFQIRRKEYNQGSAPRIDYLYSEHKSRLELLHRLIENGVEINPSPESSLAISPYSPFVNDAPLYYFLREGFSKEAQILIDAGVNLTPETYVFTHNQKETATKKIIKNDINRAYESSLKGSWLSPDKGNPENVLIMDQLIQKGANICDQPERLIWRKGRHNEQGIYAEKYYWNNGEIGKTIFETQMKIVKASLSEKCSSAHQKMGNNFRNSKQRLVSAYAQRPDQLPIVLGLVDPINTLFSEDTSKPMSAAIEALNVESMRILSNAGATLPPPNRDGDNSLNIVTSWPRHFGSPESYPESNFARRQVIEQLIEWGENPYLPNKYGRKAIDDYMVKAVMKRQMATKPDESKSFQLDN